MARQMTDPYVVLGIPRDADDQQVRDAYRRLAKRYHPDLHPGAHTSDAMRRINEAWHVLSDPVRRARYGADQPQMKARKRSATTGATRRARPSSGPARPMEPTWARASAGAASQRDTTDWGSSVWPSRPAGERGGTADVAVGVGPPWLGIAVVVAVGWFALGGLVGGFLLPVVLAILALVAARWVLGRAD